MDIGIGFPHGMPSRGGELILDWARRADQGPFSSLSVIDRIVYPNPEPLMVLAAAAAVTTRIRLMTAVLLAPLRNAGLLAKQAATIDALSGGRLTLGLGVGGREDDSLAAPAAFHTRGRRFDEQLAVMKRIWSGLPAAEGVGPVGPRPVQEGGPEILIGGRSEAAMARVARWGDGYVSGGSRATGEEAQLLMAKLGQDWTDAGRPGKPKFVAGIQCVVGPEHAERGAATVNSYYPGRDPRGGITAADIFSSPETIKDIIKAYEQVGVDEFLLRVLVPDPEQVDRLAELVAG